MTLTAEEMLDHCLYGACDGSGMVDAETFCKCAFDVEDDDPPKEWDGGVL